MSNAEKNWLVQAEKAAKKADAFNTCHVVELMQTDKVAIKDMDEWCEQAREDYPCLFFANVFEGLR